VGWIRLDRKITENWLWEDTPFSKGQAWVDLILMANHKDNKFPLGEDVISVDRGSFITSELKLMQRWGWSKTKVRTFLSQLQNDQMLIKKSDNKKTTLTIVNYGIYQDTETAEEPKKDFKKTSKRLQKDTNNKETSITNNNIKTYSENAELNSAILDFIEFRKSKAMKAPMTDKAIELMIDKLSKLSTDIPTQIAIINQSIVSGWKGIFPLKEENKQSKQQPDQPKPNKFNQFPQRQYTPEAMSELERKLLNKGR
jgi:hypothetical protein